MKSSKTFEQMPQLLLTIIVPPLAYVLFEKQIIKKSNSVKAISILFIASPLL